MLKIVGIRWRAAMRIPLESRRRYARPALRTLAQIPDRGPLPAQADPIPRLKRGRVMDHALVDECPALAAVVEHKRPLVERDVAMPAGDLRIFLGIEPKLASRL